MIYNTVVPIPPSYNKDESLNVSDTQKYLEYLSNNKCEVVMTTAGTSQFNLLTQDEIVELNSCVSSFGERSIIGVPPLSQKAAVEFVKNNKLPSNSTYMALYPDRFYSNETIINYFSAIREHLDKPMYVHGMFTRAGRGGTWNYTADLLTELYEKEIIVGIKEEHSDLGQSYNVLSKCPKALDIIVAGGTMRRHQFLRSAGANAFLAGIGNLFPWIEIDYCKGYMVDKNLAMETKLFDVFNFHGWHRSLRTALSILGLCCFYDRMPYPNRDEAMVSDINNVLQEILL